ncbi:MAG: toxic anion resistance protein [Eubacteriales bacterium]|nr:toxic anion resistance protein [Eubacteriales bacterium]
MSEETKKPISRAQDAQENAQAATQAVGSVEEAANQPLPELVLTSEVADREKVEAVINQLEQAQKESPQAPDVQAKLAQDLDSALSDEERAAVDAFSGRIDLSNPQHVMLYGAEAQKKVSTFADSILAEVKNTDAGDVGDNLTKLIGELKTFEASAEKPKGLRALFSTAEKHIAQVQARFDDVAGNVSNIAGTLETHQVQLLKDVSMFNHLYEMNLTYFKELTMYIIAGEKRLADVRANDIPKLKAQAQKSGDTLDAQKASDLEQAADRFEKKIHDLKLTRQISLQMAPQIRLLQNNNSLLIERIQSTLVNTLPLWKNQMVLAIGMQHSQQAMRAQRAVTDMTNELLKKNADTLKQGTIETAQEAERGIIDIETLVQTNKSLIDTMNEVVRIQTEGRQKRAEAEKTLAQMENELKKRLING